MHRIFLSPSALKACRERQLERRRRHDQLPRSDASGQLLALSWPRRESTQTSPCRRRRSGPSRNCAASSQRQHRQVARLEEEVTEMQQQIQVLDRQRTLAESIFVTLDSNIQSSAMKLMETYHKLFQFGYDPIRLPDESAKCEDFVRSAALEDLRSSDFTGIDMFLRQWHLYSKYHDGIRVENTGIEVVGDIGQNGNLLVKSYGTTNLRISRSTIINLFPHVLSNEELVQWLIGKEYSISYTMVVHLDSRGRIYQWESQVDLTSALLNLLQDPMATLTMVESSMMTKAGNLLTHDDVAEEQNALENKYL